MLFRSGYKSLVGAFNQVSNYYFSAAKVWQGKTGNANLARLFFANEKVSNFSAIIGNLLVIKELRAKMHPYKKYLLMNTKLSAGNKEL